MPRFSLQRRPKWRTISLSFLLLFIVSVSIICLPRQRGPKILRVGADNAPPYQTIEPGGSIQGLTVDILNEAARRQHIRLIWIPVTTMTMADALARGVVDVWPALSRTPERDKVLHFSKPWLESSYCLLSPKKSNVTREKISGISLGVAAFPRVTSLAFRFFPDARRVSLPNNTAVVQAICQGEVAAGFLDARALESVLLNRPEGCGTVSLQVQFLPEASNPVSLAGSPLAASLIDELRDGITPLITNGFFAASLDRWAGFSGAQTRSYFQVREAQLRSDTYFYAVILLAGVSGLLIWQAWRARAAQLRATQALTAAADSESRFEAFMNHSPMVGFMKDEAGHLLYANRRFTEVFGQNLGQFIGKDDFELWPPEAATKIRKDDLQVLRENRSVETVDSVPAASGAQTTWLSMKFPFHMGGATFLGGVSIDITERESDKESLRISEERFRRTFEHAAIGIAILDADGRVLEANPVFCDITGCTPEELSRVDLTTLTHPDDREASRLAREEANAGGRNGYHLEKRYLRKNASAVWSRVNVGIVRDVRGAPTCFIVLVEDITLEKQREELALLSEQRWQLALQGSTDGIWDWDARNNTVFLSPRWKEMLGFEDAEIPNRAEMWETLLHPQDLESERAAVLAHLEKRSDTYQAEYRLRCKDGGYKWVLARGKAIWDAAGNPVRLIGTHTDITERKIAEEHLLYQASHDPLTGLVNRRYFLSRLEEEIIHAQANGETLSLCVCDIDNFKSINDREGHRSGDDVLVTLANLLRDGIRKQDLAGRMGGDEFYLLLPRTATPEAMICMERIRNRLQTIAFGGNTESVFGVTASFGISDLRGLTSSAELIEMADRTLYEAKERGRNLVYGAPL